MILRDETTRRVMIEGDTLEEALRNAADYVKKRGADWERCVLLGTIEAAWPGGSYVTLIYGGAGDAEPHRP